MTGPQSARAERVTIGLTPAGRQALQVCMGRGWFVSGESALKFAAAYALANEITPTAGGSFETIWNVGTFSRAPEFRETVEIVTGSEDVWDAIQRLGDAGLRRLADLNADLPSDVS